MTEHQEPADRLERELDDMEEQGRRVEARIEETRKDWEAAKRDPSVPGAGGELDRHEGGEEPPPEAREGSPD
jgi:phage shock protein A